MANLNVVSIILKAFGAQETADAIKKPSNACEQLGATIQGIQQKITGFIASIYSMRKAWEFTEMAAQFQEQKTSLNTLAAQYGTTADVIIGNVREAANGLISLSDAAQVSAKGILMGLNPDQLTRFMQIVEATTNVVGQEVALAFEQIAEATASGNERSLKQVGILVDIQEAYRRYADSIGVTAQELTEQERQQAGINAVLERGAEIMGRLGSSTDSVSDKMERLRVIVADLKLSIGDLIIRAGAGLLGVFHAIDIGLVEMAEAAVKPFALIEKGLNMIGVKSGFFQGVSENLRLTNDELYKHMVESFSVMTSSMTEAKQTLQTALPDMGKTMSDYTDKTIKDRRKWMEWEWAYADTVDRAGQEIIDNLEKRDRAAREYAQMLQAAREAGINSSLKEIELAEQNFQIPKADAVLERIRLNEELVWIQAEYLAQLDKIKDPASWYAQKNAIDQTKESLAQLSFALKEQTGTFGQGLLQGINQFTREANTAFQHGADFARQTAQAMQSSFSDFFFDAMRGELKSFGDYWRSFSQMIMRIISEMMVKILMTKALMSMGFGVMHSGGLVMHKGGYIPRFHGGGLSSDEVPAILQRGEYVVSRKGVEGIGVNNLNAINRGRGISVQSGQTPTVINHITIQAIDAGSFAAFAQKNKEVFANMVMSSASNNHPIRRR